MRNQLNQLLEIATDLRNLLTENIKVISNPIKISDNIKVHTAGTDYMNLTFSDFPNRLEISIYCKDSFIQKSINIDIDRIFDKDLNDIILRSKEEIAIFKDSFKEESILKNKKRIIELQKELKTLSDVHTS